MLSPTYLEERMHAISFPNPINFAYSNVLHTSTMFYKYSMRAELVDIKM